jgi:hypothetical protein
MQALDRTQPGLTKKKGPLWHYDARLHQERQHHAVCPPQCAGRQGHRPLHATSIGIRSSSACSTRSSGAVPAGELIHAIADHDATHKHPKVREWLVRHPRDFNPCRTRVWHSDVSTRWRALDPTSTFSFVPAVRAALQSSALMSLDRLGSRHRHSSIGESVDRQGREVAGCTIAVPIHCRRSRQVRDEARSSRPDPR